MDPGRYEPLEVIGSGGMATVWRARDTLLGRFVAVKRPNRSSHHASIDTARFLREARAAATVAHPHLVGVHDAGVDEDGPYLVEDGPYLVMELVSGPSLAAADVAPERAARIGTEVASALAALHTAGVVHGDVKPGNILLANDGAKLTDFGIAHTADDTAPLGRPSAAFGTPAYAAPETMSDGVHSAAADIYSLAVTLHAMVTGARWTEPATSTQSLPPRGWAAVLTPALSAVPTDRPTAATLAASLASLDGGGLDDMPTTPILIGEVAAGPPAAEPDAPDPSRRVAIGAFAMATLLIVVILAVALRDRDGVTGAAPGTESPAASGASPSSAPAPTTPASTTPAVAAPPTGPSTSSAPATTTQPDAASTTAAPVTSVASAAPSAADVGAALVQLVGEVPRSDLKQKEAREIVDRIDEAVQTASRDPDQREARLRDAVERIDDHLPGRDRRARAEALLVDLAIALELRPTIVTDAFDGHG